MRIFPTPQDVEAAFYEALERSDIELMMAVWAEDEEVVCVHPGGARLIGQDQVRDSWRQILAGGARARVHLTQQTAISGPMVAVTACTRTSQRRGEAPAAGGGRHQRLPAHRRGLAHDRAPRLARAGPGGAAARSAEDPALMPYQAPWWLPGGHLRRPADRHSRRRRPSPGAASDGPRRTATSSNSTGPEAAGRWWRCSTDSRAAPPAITRARSPRRQWRAAGAAWCRISAAVRESRT